MVFSFDFLLLPIAGLSGFVFFADFPEIWVWTGATVIVAATIYLVHRETVADRAGG